jgi:Bacterial low temperature requirement A protein (LtrA)
MAVQQRPDRFWAPGKTAGAKLAMYKRIVERLAAHPGVRPVWLISILIPSPFRYALWAVAMAIDLAIPPRAWAALKGHSVVISHLRERFGTFFIIVLGESVVAVVTGVAGFELTIASWIVGGLGMVIALCLWWIYFDLADTSVGARSARAGLCLQPLPSAGWGGGVRRRHQARNRASGATQSGSGDPLGAGRRNRGVRAVAGSAPHRSRVDLHGATEASLAGSPSALWPSRWP